MTSAAPRSLYSLGFYTVKKPIAHILTNTYSCIPGFLHLSQVDFFFREKISLPARNGSQKYDIVGIFKQAVVETSDTCTSK